MLTFEQNKTNTTDLLSRFSSVTACVDVQGLCMASTHRLLHYYGYERIPPYWTGMDGPALSQCQPSDVQYPLKETQGTGFIQRWQNVLHVGEFNRRCCELEFYFENADQSDHVLTLINNQCRHHTTAV